MDLLAARGALTPGELATALRAEGVVLHEHLLGRLPERWPDLFGLDGLGRFTTAVATRSQGTTDDDRPPNRHDRWWEQADDIAPLSPSRVLVVAIDTTGNDPERDHLQRIVTMNVGTGETTLIDVTQPDDAAGADALATAFGQLDEQLERSDAISGNLVSRFTVLFLTTVARRAGLEWQTSLPGVDLHALSLVVDPTLVGRVTYLSVTGPGRPATNACAAGPLTAPGIGYSTVSL